MQVRNSAPPSLSTIRRDTGLSSPELRFKTTYLNCGHCSTSFFPTSSSQSNHAMNGSTHHLLWERSRAKGIPEGEPTTFCGASPANSHCSTEFLQSSKSPAIAF